MPKQVKKSSRKECPANNLSPEAIENFIDALAKFVVDNGLLDDPASSQGVSPTSAPTPGGAGTRSPQTR